MATVIGARGADGVCLIGDHRVRGSDDSIRDSVDHVFSFEEAILGVVGPPHAMQEFQQRTREAVRSYTLERDAPISRAAYREILRDAATRNGIDCLGATRADDGMATLIEVDRTGSVYEPPMAAIGTGAQLARGALENIDRTQPVRALTTALEDIMAVVAQRDAETSDTTNVVTVRDRTTE